MEVFIDADGLNEIDLGTGAAYNPEDALRLYFQTGSVVGRSYTQMESLIMLEFLYNS